MINVAVTGSGGFIGKKIMDLNQEGFIFSALDIRTLMSGHMHENEPVPNHVIHLAAKTFVPDSWKTPGEFYQVNVMGTQAVLDYCRKYECSMTYVSSYVYGVPAYLPIDEKHPLSPNTPYNHSKLMGEELCEFYHRYYGINVAIIRPFNIYGPGQDASFLIPKIVDQVLNNDKIELHTLDPKRDYLYVDDFLEALIATIHFKGLERFNLGTGSSISVKDVAEQLLQLSGKTEKTIVASGITRENEVMDVVANADKFKACFNWMPEVTMKEGLKRILESESNANKH